MGGPGSGGYKNSPGDTVTHQEWEVVELGEGSAQKLPQVRCKHCSREMAQHTSRQRAHLVSCREYLSTMKERGIETSITKQAEDPATFFRESRGALASGRDPKPPKHLKMQEHSTAVRIQALALAEAYISSEKIQEITGIEPKVLAGLRKLARDRGYDPNISMQLKEEYVLDPPSAMKSRGRPKKRKEDDDIDPSISQMQDPSRAPPGYVQAEGLPPGNWNFSSPVSNPMF